MGAQAEKRNYYEVLHVSTDAPPEIIRGSYRTLMQQLGHHPDLGGDTATAALINEAYAVLSNTERRAEYDARLELMTHIAHGMPGCTPDPQPAAKPERGPDLSRECAFCRAPHNFGSVIEVDTCCQSCNSPLFAAEHNSLETEGQRAVERIERQQRVIYYTQWPQPKGHTGYIEDMSLNGLRLVARQDLAEGQRIKIVSNALEAVAQVTNRLYEHRGWTRRCIAGVSFVTLRFAQSAGGFVSDRV